MQAYQVRLIKEYEDLHIRYYKLKKFVQNAKLDKVKTPTELLLEQLDVMERYLCILFERLKYEDVFMEVSWNSIKERLDEIIAE